MYQFSKKSKERLYTCAEPLVLIMTNAIGSQLMDFSIICGHRGEEEQNSLYPKYTKLKYPDSKHNSSPSMAVDIAPYPIDWEDIESFFYLAGVVMRSAVNLGYALKWGGHWKTFKDYPHFELV